MFHVDVKPAALRFPNQNEPHESKNESGGANDLKATSPPDQVDEYNRQRGERLSNVDAQVINGVRECPSLWREIVSYEAVGWGTTSTLEETQAEPGDENDPD
jgi:hypothetical protein